MKEKPKSYTEEEEQNLIKDIEKFGDRPIVIELSLPTLISIIGSLQLALRHPLNTGPSTRVIKSFIIDIRDRFSGYPAIQKLIDRGFNKDYDYIPP